MSNMGDLDLRLRAIEKRLTVIEDELVIQSQRNEAQIQHNKNLLDMIDLVGLRIKNIWKALGSDEQVKDTDS